MSVFSTKMPFLGAGMLLPTPGRCYSELLSDPTGFLQSFQSHCLWDAGVRSLHKETCLCCSLALAVKRREHSFNFWSEQVPGACPAMSSDPCPPSHHAIRTGGGLGAKSFSQTCAMMPAARASPRTFVIVRSRSLQREHQAAGGGHSQCARGVDGFGTCQPPS